MISSLPDHEKSRNRAVAEARHQRLESALSQAEHYWHGQRRPADDKSWADELAAAKASFLETERLTPSEVSINYQRDAKLNRLKALYAPDFLDTSVRQLLAQAAAQLPVYSAALKALVTSLDRAVTIASSTEDTPVDINFGRYLDTTETAARSSNPDNGRTDSLKVLLDQFPKPLSSDLLEEIAAAHRTLYDCMEQHLPGRNQATSALMSVLMPGTHIAAGEGELREHASDMLQQAIRNIRAGESETQALSNLRASLPKSFGLWMDSARASQNAIADARVPLTGLNPKVPHPAPTNLTDYALEQIGIPHLTPAEMRDANEAANRTGFGTVHTSSAHYLDPTSKAAQLLGISGTPRRGG